MTKLSTLLLHHLKVEFTQMTTKKTKMISPLMVSGQAVGFGLM